MKIVFNTDQVFQHGGIEKVMATKVNYFVNEPETKVFIVTTEQNQQPPCYPIDARVKMIDLEVNYKRSQSYFTLYNIRKAITHLKKQYRLYKELEPDVIISPNYNFDHFWLPFILPKKTKLIKEIHSSRFQEPIKRKQKGLLNWCNWKVQDWIEGKYHKVVVLNKDEAQYRPHNNVVVLPNPVEPFESSALLNAKKVMAAGRIAPVKAFDELIEAWQLVYEKFPDWELHIYGDDYNNTVQDLNNIITRHKLQDVVQIKSSVENLMETMLEYSIFALSSKTECFPTVLLEALTVGLPVVSYNCPNGPRNIITDGEDGLLVNERNHQKLAKAMMIIIENEALKKQMGKNAVANSKKFHSNSVMKQWIKILKN